MPVARRTGTRAARQELAFTLALLVLGATAVVVLAAGRALA